MATGTTIMSMMDILCEELPSDVLFRLSSADPELRKEITRHLKNVDITLTPSEGKDYESFPLHTCIAQAPNLRSIRINVKYSCGYGCHSKYLLLSVEDLTSLKCAKVLRKLELCLDNISGSMTDEDEYFDSIKDNLAGLEDLNVAECYPNLEELTLDINNMRGTDSIHPDVRTLPKSCYLLDMVMDGPCYRNIPNHVSHLHLRTYEGKLYNDLINLSVSPAAESNSLQALKLCWPQREATARSYNLWDYIPRSLTSLSFYTWDIQAHYDWEEISKMSNLIHLNIGYVQRGDNGSHFDIEPLCAPLPPSLTMLEYTLGKIYLGWNLVKYSTVDLELIRKVQQRCGPGRHVRVLNITEIQEEVARGLQTPAAPDAAPTTPLNS